MNEDLARPSTAPAGTFAEGSGLKCMPSNSYVERRRYSKIDSCEEVPLNTPHNTGMNMRSVRKRGRSFAKSLAKTKSLYIRTIHPTSQPQVQNCDEIEASPAPTKKSLSSHDRFLVTRNVQTRLGTTGEALKSPFHSSRSYSALPNYQKRGAFFRTEAKSEIITKYTILSKKWQRHHAGHIKRFNRKWQEKNAIALGWYETGGEANQTRESPSRAPRWVIFRASACFNPKIRPR